MTASTQELRVLLTRTAGGNAAWGERLLARGVTPVALACLQAVPVPGSVALLRAACAGADVLAFTSPRGVAAARAALGALPAGLRVAAVGPVTAAAAQAAFGRTDAVADGATAADLGVDVLALVPPAVHVVVAMARDGRPDLPTALRAAGVSVTVVEVYGNEPLPRPPQPRDLGAERLDAIFLASPSALRGLLGQARLPAAVPLVTIGPTTSAAVRETGLIVFAESATRDVEGLLDAFVHQRALEGIS